MRWDDLKIAIAVHQGGSYAAAAERLSVNETTIARRIERLQGDLGYTVFEAVDGGRRPTEAGLRLLQMAVEMDGAANRIAHLGKADAPPAETIRISATDSVSTALLGKRATPFLLQNPGVRLQIQASTELVNFSRWEADIALRMREPEKGDFLMSRVASLNFFYVRPSDAGEMVHLVYPDGGLDATPESLFLESIGKKVGARMVTKNLVVMRAMIEAGGAAGVLPGFMCGDLFGDPRFEVTPVPGERGVWLLLQQHLKDSAAARATVDWIKRCFKEVEQVRALRASD